MKITPERKETIAFLMKRKNKRIEEKICDTSYENVFNLISVVTNTKNINELTEKQAEALELLLVLL